MSLRDAIIQPVANDGVVAREREDRGPAVVDAASTAARREDQNHEDLNRQNLRTHVASSRDERDHRVWIQDRIALMRQLSTSHGAGRSFHGALRVAPWTEPGATPRSDSAAANPSIGSSTPANPDPGSATPLASQRAGGSTPGSRAGRPAGPHRSAESPVPAIGAGRSGPSIAAPATEATAGGIGTYGGLTAETAAHSVAVHRPSQRELLSQQKKFTWGANVNMVDGIGRFVDTVESAAMVDARATARRGAESSANEDRQPPPDVTRPHRHPSLSARSWRDHVPAAVAYKV